MRIRYYDYLESLAIFIVLSFHQVWIRGDLPATISMSFVPMAVPLFFMVHGALILRKEPSTSKQVKRFLKVLCQLYIWNTIYLLVSVATGLTSLSEITPGFLFRFYFCRADCSGITSGHLWFIYALLVLYALYPMLMACKNQNEKILKYVLIVCFFVSFVRQEILVYVNFICQKFFGAVLPDEKEILGHGSYFNPLFFFLYGYFLTEWLKKHPQLKEKRKLYAPLALLGVLVGIALLVLERYVVFGTVNYNWKPLPDQYKKIGTLIAATSCFVLFSLFDFKNDKVYAVAKTISLHSLDIFYIHVIYARLARVYLYSPQLSGVWQNYLRALIILVLSYLTGLILRKIPIVKRLM